MKLRTLLLAVIFALASGGVARADVPTVSASFSFTAANQYVVLPLTGQSSCAVTVTSVGGGTTLVPSGASDGTGTTYTTATSIGSGSITATGIYIGLVAPYGLTQFKVTATAVTSGTVTGVATCSGAIAFANSGNYVQLSPGSQQTGNINVSGSGTFGGALSAGTATLGGSGSANQVNGSLLAYANNLGTAVVPTNGSLASSIDNQTGELFLGGTSHSIHFDYNVTNSLAGTISTTLYLGGQLLARSGGSYFTDSYVPPVYSLTGTAVNNNFHGVAAQVTATGASTTVTFSSSTNAPFTAAGDYKCDEADTTAATAPSTWTYTSGTSASFTSTNTHVYYIVCWGF